MQDYRVLILIVTITIGLFAADANADKSKYTLFNPTPLELMRELSTDRPDTTESPNTVDAGHVQLELSFIDYVRDRTESDFEEYSLMPLNLKVGLLNNTDIQFVVDPYVRHVSKEESIEGFGNTQIRLKNNLWGNDEGDTALAVMPFIQFPSGNGGLSSNHIEWGLIVPLSLTLPNEYSLGLMAELDFIRNEDDTEFNRDFVHTAVIGRTLYGDLAGFVEYVGISPSESGESYQATLNVGNTYGYTENIQFDCGIGIGLNDNADDLNLFVGISLRM